MATHRSILTAPILVASTERLGHQFQQRHANVGHGQSGGIYSNSVACSDTIWDELRLQ